MQIQIPFSLSTLYFTSQIILLFILWLNNFINIFYIEHVSLTKEHGKKCIFHKTYILKCVLFPVTMRQLDVKFILH